MTPLQETLDSIKALHAEQDRLIRTLDLWAAVQAQGIGRLRSMPANC